MVEPESDATVQGRLFLIEGLWRRSLAGAGSGGAGLDLGWAGLVQSGKRMHSIEFDLFYVERKALITSFVVNSGPITYREVISYTAYILWCDDLFMTDTHRLNNVYRTSFAFDP